MAESSDKTQRVRDPVHGLIAFEYSNSLDQLAWKLINTPEFQRLRRIRQLGVSEFVFPGATHTRFSHSIGVFHTARKLVQIVDREMRRVNEVPNPKREEVAIIAALLHDLGHGPFSHTFEGVQKSRGVSKRHELWTAEIIRNPRGEIRPLLDRFREGQSSCEEVALLLEAEEPTDIYHAVVSSSFDADRLDYLRRDRLMTGTGAGAIDLDWLLEHIRVGKVLVEAPDSEEGEDQDRVPTFCLDGKALAAAEQFLLSRYTLHQQVYFHKTTRCVEKMISKLLMAVSKHCSDQLRVTSNTGLPSDHPLVMFFRNSSHKTEGNADEALASYLKLDDMLIIGALDQLKLAGDKLIANLSARLLNRQLYKTFDLASVGQDEGKQKKRARRIEREFEKQISDGTVIRDEASINIYTQIGGDDERTHKKLHILDAGEPREISLLSPLVAALKDKKNFVRYYFENESDRESARRTKG